MKNLDTEALTDLGCFRLSCKWVSWQNVQSNFFTSPNAAPTNTTVVQLRLQKSLLTTVYKHTLTYQVSNFIADFGGYLGLLLGASLISIYDDIVVGLEKLFEALYKRPLKKH